MPIHYPTGIVSQTPVDPKYSVDDFFATYPFQQDSDIEAIRKGLQEAQGIAS